MLNLEISTSITKPSKGFAALSNASACRLILGSLPGVLSIQRQEYYAHPRNVFWRIMGSLFGFDPLLPYEKRVETLKASGVALWDVCASAHRDGSLDSAIKNHAVNDFAGFYIEHPRLERIF